VLCDYIRKKPGGVRSASQCAGRLGWFHLRLTRQECLDLFVAAESEGFIEPASTELHPTTSNDPADVVWKLTDKGRGTSAPLGGGARDTAKRTPAAVVKVFKVANGLPGAAVITAVVATVGLAITEGSAEAQSLLILGLWGIVLALVVGAYSDEKALRAGAKAWPRMEHYRPARYRHATDWMRTPMPFAVFVVATVGAVVSIAAILLGDRTPPEPLPASLKTGALIVVGLTVVFTVALGISSRRSRAAYQDEYKKRRPPFNRSDPEPEDELWTRIKRIVLLTLPRRLLTRRLLPR
jgi:hypothetical protein